MFEPSDGSGSRRLYRVEFTEDNWRDLKTVVAKMKLRWSDEKGMYEKVEK